MSATALLVADAGPEDGLGHLSRLSAIAVALRSRRIETECHAYQSAGPLERDGVTWAPWSPGDPVRADADVVIVDSYRLEPESVIAAPAALVLFRDHGDVGPMPSLVVSVAAPPSDDPRWLCGPRYAAVRPSYWELPPKDASGPVRSVLVTTGGGDPGGIGIELARSVAELLPEADVILVRGPYAPALPVDRVRALAAPDSLFDLQLAADLVICGGGQTMLETAACGTPCISLVLVENQREQTLRLASSGAVVLVDPGDVDGALGAVRSLDVAARLELSRRAQDAVDGHGAHRIAHHIEALLGRAT